MYYPLLGQVTFWVLIIWGWITDGLSVTVRVTFVALWIAGSVVFPYLPNGHSWFAPYVAVLDLVLVLIVLRDSGRLP